jgi:hypothetical protein
MGGWGLGKEERTGILDLGLSIFERKASHLTTNPKSKIRKNTNEIQSDDGV